MMLNVPAWALLSWLILYTAFLVFAVVKFYFTTQNTLRGLKISDRQLELREKLIKIHTKK